jgi:hypothetical protein
MYNIEKLKQIQPYEVKMDFLFEQLYEDFNKSDFLERIDLPKYRGVYVFYEKEDPIYVGRANNIRSRIQWHTRASSGSESASFAFNLAKRDYFSKDEISKTRKQLMQIEEFIEIFKSHKLKLSNVKFKCIAIENDILQTMFEPYLAYKLQTYPLNNTFENH